MSDQAWQKILDDMSSLNNELINAQRDLQKKKSEIDLLNTQLNAVNTELRQFASIASHNLRAPVNNILSLANIMRGDFSAEDKARSQQYLFKATEQLQEIIEDLNTILKTKSEEHDGREVVFFEQIVSKIKSTIPLLLEMESVQINTDFKTIDRITTNKNYIYSAFYNLISNSIKYRHQSRTPVINIRTETRENKILIYFKDNGTGIDLEKNGTQLFGLYKRFSSSAEGKGLGLHMVKTQIELMGGSIKVSSAINEYTEFIVELPS